MSLGLGNFRIFEERMEKESNEFELGYQITKTPCGPGKYTDDTFHMG